jgi:hypothetical protein
MKINRIYMDAAGDDGGASGGAGSEKGQSQGGDWKESLPEELRNDPTIQNTKDVAGLASQLVNSQKMLGAAIRIPGKDAGEDDWNTFYGKLESVPGIGRVPSEPSQDPEGVSALFRKLGTPEKADGYKFTRPDQADTIMQGVYSETLEGARSMQEQRSQLAEDLKKEFGNGLEAALHDSSQVLSQLGDEELDQVLQQHGLDQHPAVLRFAGKMASFLREGGVELGDRPSNAGITPAEAKSQIAEIQNNPDHPYHDRTKAGHKEAVDRFLWLHEQIHAR